MRPVRTASGGLLELVHVEVAHVVRAELRELRAILEVDPENLMCACSLGRLHQYQGRHEEALGELLRVLGSPDVPKGAQLGQLSVQLAVSSAAALSHEANELSESGGGSFFFGPALAFVPIEGERALQLHHLALQALQLALPHADNSDMGSEIVLVNLAKSLCDLGHFEKAAAAASRALECRGLPGAVRSFASNSIGRAAEAEGGGQRGPPHGAGSDKNIFSRPIGKQRYTVWTP